MPVGLFIPCYMDAFEPEVGIATLELLERLGCTVEYPVDQTCCGMGGRLRRSSERSSLLARLG
jgi:Fe-S oxidoreductase